MGKQNIQELHQQYVKNNMSRKENKRKRRLNSFCFAVYFFIVAGIMVIISCNHSRRISNSSSSYGEKELKHYGACELLKKLNSTTYLYSLSDQKKIVSIIQALFDKTQLEENFSCYYGGCVYHSYDLEKSLYKLDLIKLNRYYRCVDTLPIISSKNFTENEILTIKERLKFGHPIDTSLFIHPRFQ